MTFTFDATPVVVDASVVIDAVQGVPYAASALEGWATQRRTLIAPAIFWPEVGHVLIKKGRPAVEVAGRIDLLAAMGVETAYRGPQGVVFALALAERHRLSVYDATYLWLAIDVDGELATFDQALARAAVAEGVPLALAPEP